MWDKLHSDVHWEKEQQMDTRHPDTAPIQPFAEQLFAHNLVVPSGG